MAIKFRSASSKDSPTTQLAKRSETNGRLNHTTGRGTRVVARVPRFVFASAAVAAAGAVLVGYSNMRTAPHSAHVQRETPATAADLAYGPANNSPLLAADPTDGRFIALANRLDAPDFSCALQVSGDRGASWQPARPITQLPAGAEKCYAPDIVFDRHGVLYYLYVGLHGQGNEPVGAYLTKSSDRGRTFSEPRQILGPNNFGVRLAVDPRAGTFGRLFLVWLHASSDTPTGGFAPGENPILSAYSDDGGITFSNPVRVSDPSRVRVAAPALAVAPNGTLAVAYYDLGDDARDYQGLEGPTWDGRWSLVISRSRDHGVTFGRGEVIDGNIVPSERVMLIYTMPPPSLVLTSKGYCTAWTDARDGDPDIYLKCSPGSPRAVRVNQDRRGSGKRQYLPRLGEAPNGRLDVIYYDRDDGHNRLNDVSYTFSNDGGRTFVPSVRLTSNSSDVGIGQRYTVASAEGQVEWGSRLGLVSSRSGILSAWADTRNSLQLTTEQDIFTTHAEVEGGRRGLPTWAILLFGVACCGAFGAAAAGRRRAPTAGED